MPSAGVPEPAPPPPAGPPLLGSLVPPPASDRSAGNIVLVLSTAIGSPLHGSVAVVVASVLDGVLAPDRPEEYERSRLLCHDSSAVAAATPATNSSPATNISFLLLNTRLTNVTSLVSTGGAQWL